MFWAYPAADHAVFYKNQDSIFYSYLPNYFRFRSRLGGLLKRNKKWQILSIFSRLGYFPQVFGQL